MKTIQLVDYLTNAEVKAFKLVIKSVNKKSTQRLFQFLLKNKKKAEKATHLTIYKAVFGTEYSAAKDYLVRNELRLLNQLLEKFIAQKALPPHDEKYLFLTAILERGLVDLFEKEVKKEIKKREAVNDYERLARLHQLILDKNIKNKTLKESNFRRDITLCEDIIFYENKHNFYRRYEIKMTQAYFVKNVQMLGKKSTFVFPEKTPDAYDDAYLQYLLCKMEGFVSETQKKRESLQRSLALLADISYEKIDNEKAKISILNNLALEYLIAFDYQNAVNSFEQLLQNKTLSGQFLTYVSFNYLICLLKSEQYSKAIKLIEAQFVDTPAVLEGKINGIKAMAWIYVGDLEKAYAVLPLNLKKSSRGDYFYARLVLAIIYYLESNIDIAEREIENILQTIDNNRELVPHRFCAQALRKFFASEFKPQKKAALLATVNTFIRHEGENYDLLPLLWLRKELESK